MPQSLDVPADMPARPAASEVPTTEHPPPLDSSAGDKPNGWDSKTPPLTPSSIPPQDALRMAEALSAAAAASAQASAAPVVPPINLDLAALDISVSSQLPEQLLSSATAPSSAPSVPPLVGLSDLASIKEGMQNAGGEVSDLAGSLSAEIEAVREEATPNRILLVSHGGFIGEMLAGAGSVLCFACKGMCLFSELQGRCLVFFVHVCEFPMFLFVQGCFCLCSEFAMFLVFA